MMFKFELLTVENFVTPKFVARSSVCAVDLFKKSVLIIDCTTGTLLASMILVEFESISYSFTLITA